MRAKRTKKIAKEISSALTFTDLTINDKLYKAFMSSNEDWRSTMPIGKQKPELTVIKGGKK